MSARTSTLTRDTPAVVSRVDWRRRLARVVLLAIVVLVIIIVVFPYYWMIVSSMEGASIFQWPPRLTPSSVTLDYYVSAFAKRPIALWFRNSAFVSLTAALLSTFIAINAGYSLSRFKNRANLLFGIGVLLTQMLPASLLVVPFYVIYRELQLLDNLVGLSIATTTFAMPLCIWLMKGFFDSIPIDLEEQALVDGCSRLGAFYRITLPLSLPGLVVVAVFAFLAGWDEYFFAQTLISSEENRVLSVGLMSFRGEYTIQWNEMMAAAVVFTIPAAIFFLIVQRYLLHGLTGGAVKG